MLGSAILALLLALVYLLINSIIKIVTGKNDVLQLSIIPSLALFSIRWRQTILFLYCQEVYYAYCCFIYFFSLFSGTGNYFLFWAYLIYQIKKYVFY